MPSSLEFPTSSRSRSPTHSFLAVVNRTFFMTDIWVVGYTSVFLQNLQRGSLYLSERAKAFVRFHLLSHRTSPHPV